MTALLITPHPMMTMRLAATLRRSTHRQQPMQILLIESKTFPPHHAQPKPAAEAGSA